MTTYVVGIDNTVGASADNQTKATVIQILQNAGHTVYDAGRGPNQVQSFGKRSEASGAIAVYLVGGSDIGTYVDFQEGIGHYYKYSECIFAFQSWIGNRWITCEGLSTIPLVRAHDDNFSKQSAIQPYLGQPATYFFEQSPNCSYVCGDSAEELANKILNGDDGGGTSTSGDGQETWGYDKSKPFEAYMYVNYWINDDRENNHKIYIDFSKEAMTTSYKFKDFKTESFSHKLGAWLNDTIKSTSFNLLEMFQIANDDLQGKNTYWLNTIGFETHFPPVDGEFVSKDSDGNETNNNVAYDSSKDHSSYKMDLYSLVFYNGEDLSAIDYDSYAQPVNDTLKKVLGDTSYCIDMLYKPHRNEDVMVFKNQNKKMSSKCTFVEDPYADLKYKADPIKYIPITKISNIQYSPLKNTITNYNVSFKELYDMFEETHYMSSCTYVNLDKLMRYGEISKNKELQDTYGLSEAKFIALNQYLKENNEETTFTISCEGLPPCSIGDVVGTEMYRRELTNLYNVSSMAINIDRKKRPIIQTELGLGDIDRAIKVNETLEAQRKQLHSLSKDSIYPRYTGKDEKLWSD